MEGWLKLGKGFAYMPDEWEVLDICGEEYEEEGYGPGTGADWSFHQAQQGAECGRESHSYYRTGRQGEYALVSG